MGPLAASLLGSAGSVWLLAAGLVRCLHKSFLALLQDRSPTSLQGKKASQKSPTLLRASSEFVCSHLTMAGNCPPNPASEPRSGYSESEEGLHFPFSRGVLPVTSCGTSVPQLMSDPITLSLSSKRWDGWKCKRRHSLAILYMSGSLHMSLSPNFLFTGRDYSHRRPRKNHRELREFKSTCFSSHRQQVNEPECKCVSGSKPPNGTCQCCPALPSGSVGYFPRIYVRGRFLAQRPGSHAPSAQALC